MAIILRTLGAAALVAGAAAAQLPGERPPRTNPPDLPLASTLYDAWILRGLPLEELRERVVRGFIDIDDARRVEIELVGPRGDAAVSDELVRSFGGEPGARYRRLLDARVPLAKLVDLARALPEGHRVRVPIRPEPTDVAGEGPAATGSQAWRDGGSDGSGKTVAIIDSDFDQLDEAVANGDLGAWHATNYTGEPLQSKKKHGTACAETVYDHAPGATFRLYKIDSSAQLGLAVQDCIDQGVDVISLSQGYSGDFWSDDEGEAAEAVREAAQAGILVFTSVGNAARKHWQGGFSAYMSNSGWHGWVPGDHALEVRVPPDESVRFTLTWNTAAPGTDDYDLFLYNYNMSVAVASSTNAGEAYEEVAWKNPSATESTLLQVAVWRDAGTGTEFELFGDDVDPWEHHVAAGSSTAPSNCTHPNVISVGAVHHGLYASPEGTTGILADYSSLGPTNGGAPRPAIVAPTGTLTFSAEEFHGTSCSAPNAAGMALCLWSSAPAYNASAIGWLVKRQAAVLRDWGTGGQDNEYGHGGASLIDFAPDTRWLTNEYGNPAGSVAAPANTLAHALVQTPVGGRIVAFPGGDFPAPILLTKPVTLVSRGADALCGD